MIYVKTCFCHSSASLPTPVTPSWPLWLLPTQSLLFCFLPKELPFHQNSVWCQPLSWTPGLYPALTSANEDACEMPGHTPGVSGCYTISVTSPAGRVKDCGALNSNAAQRPTKCLLNMKSTWWSKKHKEEWIRSDAPDWSWGWTPSDFTVNASSENLSLHCPCKAIHFPTLRYSQLNSLEISFNIVSLCLAVQEPLKLTE